MGLCKLITIFAAASLMMQSSHSASIGNGCVCTLNYDPLCGSDGQTYSNDCELNCAKKFNRNLEVFSKGECIAVEQLPAVEETPEIRNLPADLDVVPCVCPFINDPLCGSDGQTYSNDCEFRCAKKFNRNLEVYSKGECIAVEQLPAVEETPEIRNLPADFEETPYVCPFINDPLCGSDGQTYSNDCEFSCAKKFNRNLEVFSKGECIAVEQLPEVEETAEIRNLPADLDVVPCVCPFINDPLCGSDGQTYSNDCEFSCAKKFNRNLEVYSKGECIAVEQLPEIEETPEIRNLPADFEETPCVCPFINDPLCGSDGQTYSNDCEFSCAKKFNRNLEIFSKGECIAVEQLPDVEETPEIRNLPADLDVAPCVCPFINDPLCGSDGQTYSNDCEFRCAKKFNRNLEVYSKGECIAVEQLPLTKH